MNNNLISKAIQTLRDDNFTDSEIREMFEEAISIRHSNSPEMIHPDEHSLEKHQPEQRESDKHKIVKEMLDSFGVPKHILGYRYLMDAVVNYAACIRQGKMPSMTKELYPMVAKVYGSSASKVERAIRHAVEIAMSHVPDDVKKSIFGNSLNCHRNPTNSEIIAAMADKLNN